MEHDSAVLVRQMAEELVRACDEVELSGIGKGSNGKRSLSRASAGLNLRRPASSAGGRRDGSGSSTGSTLVGSGMGLTPPTPTSLKNTFMLPPGTPTALGGGRERIHRSHSSTNMWDLAEDPSALPPSSGRSKPPALARSSTSFAALQSSTSSPAMARTASRPPSRDAASSLARIEANDTRKSSSRLPKARQGRLTEAVSRRRQSGVGAENDTPGPSNGSGSGSGNGAPLPRLQIVRRRRETSGGEMSTSGRKGSVASTE
jgi:hypothetical protein